MLKNILSSKILGLVKEKNISQTEFAQMLGVSQSYISRVKNGKESFSLDRIELACRILGYPVFGLFAEELSTEQPQSGWTDTCRDTMNNPKALALCYKIGSVPDKKKEVVLDILLSMVDLMIKEE